MLRFALLLVLAASGCSLVGDDAEVGVAFVLPSRSATLTAEAEVGGRALALQPQATTGDVVLVAEPVRVSARRTPVSCTLSDGDATTRASVRLDLEGGLRYAVRCHVADRDPVELCFGCLGSERFALDPALGFGSEASLYLMWSATDPDNPVYY